MSKFRKKPVVIDAFKFTGKEKQHELPDWLVAAIDAGDVWFDDMHNTEEVLLIKTLEGVMRGDVGDYIIRGIKGEIYPCKSDIFEMSYEPVNE